MRISDWSSDVCSSDLRVAAGRSPGHAGEHRRRRVRPRSVDDRLRRPGRFGADLPAHGWRLTLDVNVDPKGRVHVDQCPQEIGSTSWRARVGQYVYIPVVAGPLKKTRIRHITTK